MNAIELKIGRGGEGTRMKTLLTFAAMFCCFSARADVSDSGNLSIGGNGVIVGSMTVIGGIATSSVTISSGGAGSYDLTSSTGIHLLGGELKLESGAYIKWPDNSTSTTAAGGGAGNVVLAATQTFSGGNTFTSSATAGASIYTTTSTVGPGAVTGPGAFVNTWMLVASTNPSNATQVYFTGLQSTGTYRLSWAVKDTGGTGATPLVRFNNDSGTNYKWIADDKVSDGSGDVVARSNGDTSCNLTYGGIPWASNHISRGTYDFTIDLIGGTRAVGTSISASGGTSVNWSEQSYSHCFYNGSSTIKSISLLVTTSNFTGYVWLEKLISPNF